MLILCKIYTGAFFAAAARGEIPERVFPMISDTLSCKAACGPGDLEIEAARLGIHIQYLPGGIEAGDPAGFHCRRVDLLYTDPAPGDNGFPVTAGPCDGDRDFLDERRQLFDFRFCKGGSPAVGLKSGQLGDHFRKSCRKQRPHRAGKVAVRRLQKLPAQAFLQLFPGKSGFQVEKEPESPRIFEKITVAGGSEYDGSAHSEMGKQKLAKGLIDRLILPGFLFLWFTFGFAVCIPQGLKDPQGEPSWNVGYPFQQGWKVDDVKALCRIARYVQKRHHLSRTNAFLTGMSNGGEMCYLMAYSKQNTFNAVAPIAGLTMLWMYEQLEASRPIPLMEIHGTEDRVSEWTGDLENKGGWGAYLPVPVAVGYWVAKNRCSREQTDSIGSLKGSEGHTIIKHRYSGGSTGCDVWLYEVIGAGHSWHTDDIDTGEEIWQFFSRYIK